MNDLPPVPGENIPRWSRHVEAYGRMSASERAAWFRSLTPEQQAEFSAACGTARAATAPARGCRAVVLVLVVLLLLLILFIVLASTGNEAFREPTTRQAPQPTSRPPAALLRPTVSTPGAIFQDPNRYIGLATTQAARMTGGRINEGGNIVIETDKFELLLEAFDGVVNHPAVSFLETKPCSMAVPFDPNPLLEAVGMHADLMEEILSRSDRHSYYDHARRRKVWVSCDYDGGSYNVALSKTYYLQ
jgi:hypothetical protein